MVGSYLHFGTSMPFEKGGVHSITTVVWQSLPSLSRATPLATTRGLGYNGTHQVFIQGEHMEKLPVVRDHMDRNVPTLSPDADIFDAIAFLLENHVTGAPVVEKSGRLVGILTEKDCLRVVALGVDGNPPRGSVASFMTPNPSTIPPSMDVYYAAGLFLTREFRRFPVVENGKLVGAITRFDILRVIRANLPMTA